MACAAEMRVAKPDNGAVFVLITSAILVHTWLVFSIDVVRHSIGVGAELYNAERRTSPWKSVPHAVRPNDGVDVLDIIAVIVAVIVLVDRMLIGATESYEPKKD